jgi:hypothetical protein
VNNLCGSTSCKIEKAADSISVARLQPLPTVSERWIAHTVQATLPSKDLRPLLEVVVVYEDSATRDRALQICDHLALELEDEVKLEFTWWRLDFLLDAQIAWEATEIAVRAGMIVMALHVGHALPNVLTHWVDTWADDRDTAEGALVGLIGLGSDTATWGSPRHELLRKIATRARMDYLPQGQYSSDEISAAALSNTGQRATSITPTLWEILHQSHPPSHWGLNE